MSKTWEAELVRHAVFPNLKLTPKVLQLVHHNAQGREVFIKHKQAHVLPGLVWINIPVTLMAKSEETTA